MGLVIWPDIFGLRPLFVDHATRLANEHAWNVVVVEPYPANTEASIEARQQLTASMDDADKLADTVAAAALTECEDVAVLGFCQGGMWAMKALGAPTIARAVAFYGMIRLPEHWTGPRIADAIDVVRDAAKPLLGIFGSEDPWCPLNQIEELARCPGVTSVVYTGADHGWAQDPQRENYRPAEASDAWTLAESFLAQGHCEDTPTTLARRLSRA
jgi:carboxymethylenebutenolidase